ncbi:MAG: multicopper oxidase domain-containing protein [Gammaproteobacteria bacterium]|nr:multicopper oxidase domain-containing protein [Gammaproteobacteria bacterium]
MNISAIIKAGIAGVLALVASVVFSAAHAATINLTKCVATLNKTMSDGATVTFWVFGPDGMMCSGALPGAAVEVGVGDTLNLTLSINGMTPQEAAPYNGHTIHLHGADVKTSEDGVPETGAAVNGDTYTWAPTAEMAGSYIYHCHVHTVKHLEMGMYGALIVRPKDAAGNFLNQITADAATAYDYVQNYVFSTVDPAYHTATGDSTVFADYNPKYFLINGNEGKTTSAPATTLAAAVSKKVALRLIGVHSVNGTFSLGGTSFTVYTQDGRAWPTAQGMTSLDITPGQRYDIIFTTPSKSGTLYPRITYKSLRDGATLATVYGKVTY